MKQKALNKFKTPAMQKVKTLIPTYNCYESTAGLTKVSLKKGDLLKGNYSKIRIYLTET